MSSIKSWAEKHAQEIRDAAVPPEPGTRGRQFRIGKKTMSTKEYCETLTKTNPDLKGVNPTTLSVAVSGVMIEAGDRRVDPYRKVKSEPGSGILDRPQTFEVQVPGVGPLLLITRDPNTKVRFEVGLASVNGKHR
jgi:hypothetical protein